MSCSGPQRPRGEDVVQELGSSQSHPRIPGSWEPVASGVLICSLFTCRVDCGKSSLGLKFIKAEEKNKNLKEIFLKIRCEWEMSSWLAARKAKIKR